MKKIMGEDILVFSCRIFLAASQQPTEETLYILQNVFTAQLKDITGKDI